MSPFEDDNGDDVISTDYFEGDDKVSLAGGLEGRYTRPCLGKTVVCKQHLGPMLDIVVATPEGKGLGGRKNDLHSDPIHILPLRHHVAASQIMFVPLEHAVGNLLDHEHHIFGEVYRGSEHDLGSTFVSRTYLHIEGALDAFEVDPVADLDVLHLT